jgi:hypothetical protein
VWLFLGPVPLAFLVILNPHPTTWWGQIRSWPAWAQILLWVSFWPAALGALAAAKPRDERPKWVALSAGGLVIWLAIAASGGSPKVTNVSTTKPVAGGSLEATSTTERHPSSTTPTPLHQSAGQPDPFHPDPSLTPGTAMVDTTKEQVCASGYSSSARDVTESTKDQVYARYGITQRSAGQYEIDHLVALELGGSNEIANLWPQPTSGDQNSSSKDAVENRLHSWVCNGIVGLADAQAMIVHWGQVPTVAPTTTAAPTTTVPPTTRSLPPTTVYVPPPTTAAPLSGCTPGYDPCIPPGSDVDCAGGSGNGPRYVTGPISVTGSDQYGLDTNHNGIGCE